MGCPQSITFFCRCGQSRIPTPLTGPSQTAHQSGKLNRRVICPIGPATGPAEAFEQQIGGDVVGNRFPMSRGIPELSPSAQNFVRARVVNCGARRGWRCKCNDALDDAAFPLCVEFGLAVKIGCFAALILNHSHGSSQRKPLLGHSIQDFRSAFMNIPGKPFAALRARNSLRLTKCASCNAISTAWPQEQAIPPFSLEDST